MRIINIDFASDEGGALLASLERNAPAVVATLKRLDRAFLVISPWAPGLFFAGGEASSALLAAPAAQRRVFSLAGSGEKLEDALASCAGESVERLSQIERPSDISRTGSLDATADLTMSSVISLASDLLNGTTELRTGSFSWVSAVTLHGQSTLVPADWCLRRDSPGSLLIPGSALSTGCAAGATFESAAARALLELIERDAACLWWVGGQRARLFPCESPAAVEASRLLSVLRQNEVERATWLLDISTELRVPVVAALSVGPDGCAFACGLAARLCERKAAHAAILEMCQIELALQFVDLKRAQRGEEGLNDIDKRHLRRATEIKAWECQLLYPVGLARMDVTGVQDEDELSTLSAAFEREGIEAALVNLTRPEFALPVVCAIAPALQRMPGNLDTPRLRRVLAATGGAQRWTRDVPLI